jgi:anti-anti-sigma factor
MTVLRLRALPPDVPVLLVSGDLAGEMTSELMDATDELISRRRPSLLIHLGRVRSIDAQAMRVLLAARQRAELLGGWVRVVRPSAPVREAFRQFEAGLLLELVD